MSSLKDLLEPVPQDRAYHPEGNVWRHVKMVRDQLYKAIDYLRQHTRDPDSPFSQLDMTLSQADMNLLRLSCYLHDIGKNPTTNIDKQPWHIHPDPHNATGKIQALGHEDPEHFEPMLARLGPQWQNIFRQMSSEEIDDLKYLIRNHMSLKDTFSRRLHPDLFNADGKYRNNRRTKLLLVLILADRMGRIAETPPEARASRTIQNMTDTSQRYLQARTPASQPAPDDPRLMAQQIAGKPLEVIQRAMKGKFRRDFSPEEIQRYLGSGS